MREKILNVGRVVGLIFDCVSQACLVVLAFIGAGFLSVLLTNIWASDGIGGLGKLFFTGLIFLGAVKIGVLRTRMRESSDDIQYVTGQLHHLASDIGRLNDMLREVLEAQLQATLDREAKVDPLVAAGTHYEEADFSQPAAPPRKRWSDSIPLPDLLSQEEREQLRQPFDGPVYEAVTAALTLGTAYLKMELVPPETLFFSNPAGPGHDLVKRGYVEDIGPVSPTAWDNINPIPFREAMQQEYVPTAQEVEEHDERKRKERIQQIKEDLMGGQPNPGQRKGLYEELQRLEKRVDAGNWPDPGYQPIEPDQEHVVLAEEETQECKACRGTGEGIEAYSNGAGAHCERSVSCPECKGSGFLLRGEAVDDLDAVQPRVTITRFHKPVPVRDGESIMMCTECHGEGRLAGQYTGDDMGECTYCNGAGYVAKADEAK